MLEFIAVSETAVWSTVQREGHHN